MHSIVWHNSSLVGPASVIQRRLVHGDQVLRTGYVEGVGVHRNGNAKASAGR